MASIAYPLAGLLRIRDFRVDEAAKAVAASQAMLATAEVALEKARAEFARYRQWRRAEVERRYRDIIGQMLSQDDLERFKQSLSALADVELEKEAACHEFERAAREARERLTQARAAWREAEREREKLRQHFALWHEAENKAALYREDRENEEFRPILVAAQDAAED